MSGVDRTQAIKLTRLSQAAAVVLVAGAAGAFLFEPALPEAPQIVRNQTPGPTATEQAPAGPIEFDIALASDMLNRAGEVTPEFPTEIETPVTPEIEPVTQPTTTSQGTGYRFLGGFFSPNRSLAIVATASGQKMVRVGDPLDFGYTVTSITDQAVELERDGEVTTLEREAPSGVMVSTATPVAEDNAETNVAPGTQVSQSARDRLRNARAEANSRTQTDRARLRADYERQRQQRIEELREQGVEVDEAEWRRDD